MMDTFLTTALSAISSAASGPLAFLAYLTAIIAYVICFLRIRRNQALLDKIEKIPKEQRVTALRNEMAGIPVPSDIQPIHWLAARRQRYKATIILISLALFAALSILAYLEYKGQISVVIGVQTSELEDAKPNGILSQIISAANAEGLDFVQPEDNPLSEIHQLTEQRYPGQEVDIGYRQEPDGQTLVIEPNFRYLDRLKAQEVIEPIFYTWEPFSWRFPELSFKVLNNSRDTLYASSIQIRVNQSTINTDPLLVVPGSQSSGNISIVNYGWGDVIDPKISLELSQFKDQCPSASNKRKFEAVEYSDNRITINAFEFETPEFFEANLMCSSEIDALCFEGSCTYYSELGGIRCLDQEKSRSCGQTDPEVPKSLIDDFLSDINRYREGEVPVQAGDVLTVRECRFALVCAFGELSYMTEDGNEEAFKFRMHVDLNPPGVGAPAPPTYTYDVFLPAGRSGYIVDVPISQVIASGETDHFLLRVATDKSASFEIEVGLYETDGDRLAESNVRLETVVPRGSEYYFDGPQKN